VNVAATVSLAGIGPDRTRVEVWADPNAIHNQHELQLCSPAGEVKAIALNLPDPVNPKSSMVTAFSIIAALRRLTATLSLGS
jgi:aspartate dehydrogenase